MSASALGILPCYFNQKLHHSLSHLLRELKGIANEIREQLDDAPLIGDNGRELGAHQGLLQHDPAFCHGAQRVHDMINDLVHMNLQKAHRKGGHFIPLIMT